MKKLIITLLVLLVGVGVQQADTTIQKHALIIAIGDYPEESNWKDISSINDIELIKAALGRQGFQNFTVLKNEEADKAGILNALRDLAENVESGDIVTVHFSSHGQQIMDNNNDELDGYDEAIVAYGAPALYDPAYNGENHLRDEELGASLDKIRTRIGASGDLLVIVDACHSGTATRGPAAKEVSRGGHAPYAPKEYQPEDKSAKKKEVGIFEDTESRSRGNAVKSPMVVISAARADELNYEYKGYGSLSVAFSRAMEQLDGNWTYRTLFSKISKEMSVIAPNQTPALEGQVDRTIFGGHAVNQEPYYRVTKVNGNNLRVEGGQVSGLHAGSTVKVFEAGTLRSDDAEPLATGEVIFAKGFMCSVNLDKELSGSEEEYWVFADQLSFGDVRVAISLDSKMSSRDYRKPLEKFMEEFHLAYLSDSSYDFKLSVNSLGKLVLLSSYDGEIYADNISMDNNYEDLAERLTTYAQGKYLKNLEFNNPHYNIELEFIPVLVMGDEIVDTLDIKDYMDEGGLITFTENDEVLIRITNHSKFDVYFNIIDIQPDGVVNPVFPNPDFNQDPRDFKIPKGQSRIIDGYVVGFGEPYGLETYKVFASYEPFNLTPIANSRGNSATRGVETDLEMLFRSNYSMSRGAPPRKLSTNSKSCTFSYTFKIERS